MKLGIITQTEGMNYGNRLQIYALEKILMELGHDPWLIRNVVGMEGVKYHLKQRIKYILDRDHVRDDMRRRKAFDRFDKKYLQIYRKTLGKKYRSSNIAKKFDAFICGSDQIWNPRASQLSGACFADFCNVKKRIAYAPSFSTESIPDDLKDQYINWLSQMNAISVREQSGADIIKNLIGIQAEVLVDPTMMLDAEKWTAIEEKPGWIGDGRYVFLYFLGEKSKKVRKYIADFCEYNKLSLVDMFPDKDEKNYELNPSNFVYLLHHSEFVITDSFHASVFSILYRKPFSVFEREFTEEYKELNMSTRLDTLLESFKLKENRNNDQMEITSPDYQYVDMILKEERKKAIRYLVEALK